MVTWNVLDAQFDDETRQAKDLYIYNSVFEVVKLVVLEPESAITNIPKLAGAAYKGLIALSVDTTVVVFGEEGSTLLLQLTLNDYIDTFVWLPCGKFLLMADCVGCLHCLHISSKQIIFSRTIPVGGGEHQTGTFISGVSYLEQNNKAVVLLLTKFGQLVRISDIDTESLITGTTSKDEALLTSVESHLSLTVEDVFEKEVTISCASFYIELGFPRAKFWAGTDEGIICWTSHATHSSESDSFLLSPLTDCSKLVILQKGRYVAALNNDGEMNIYCTETGILLWETSADIFKQHYILDFCELSCEHKSSQLLTLVGSSSDVPSNLLCLMTFPEYFFKHELSVNKDTYLIKLGDGVESSYFIEVKKTSDGTIESLNLKNIVDGLPETRLSKLLRSCKFAEAEIFCGTFNLDVSEVYKAKSKYLCDIINPWRTSNETSDNFLKRNFEELLETLDKILDLEYVTSVSCESPMPDAFLTKQLFSYGKQRIAKDFQTQSDDHLKSLMHKISENLYRLRTYEMIYSNADVHQWFEFSRKNILNEFFAHLLEGRLDVARTIWHRHQYKFCSQIDIGCVENILNSVPCNLSSDVVFNWLQNHILNDVLILCPPSIEVIAFWVDRKLKTIEYHEKEMWPTNALRLAQNVISILNNTSSYLTAGVGIEVEMALYAAHEKAHSPTSSLYQLRQTALALQDLKVLADKFRLKIKFCQYTQESKYCVVKALLDMLVCGEEVDPLFNQFLREYMRQNDLKSDQSMAQYITDTLSSYGQAWWMWDQAPWENKLYAVIRVIVDAQIKSNCILQCIQSASVPWNKETIEICNLGISLNTPLISQLESQSKLSNLKLVLRKYYIHKMNFSSGKIIKLILRSVSQKEEDDSIADAMTVVDAFSPLKKTDAYFFKLCFFMRTGKLEEGVCLFKAIEKNVDQLEVFTKFQNYVIQQLNVPPITIKCKQNVNMYTNSILLLEPLIKMYLRTSQITDLHIIRRIHTLQKYDIYLSMGDMECKNVCFQKIEEFIRSTYKERLSEIKEDCNSSRNSPLTSHQATTNVEQNSYIKGEDVDLIRGLEKVLRVAYLLGIEKEDLFTILFKLDFTQEESTIAVKFANILTEDSKVHKCISVIYDIIEKNVSFWMTNLKNGDSFASLTEWQLKKLYHLITLALSSCSNEDLAQLTNLGLWCFYGIELFDRCLLSKQYTSSTDLDDHLFLCNFTSMFKDVSVPIEPQYVSVAISSILMYCCQIYKTNVSMPFIDNEEIDFSKQVQVMDALHALVNHLQDRNQDVIYATISVTVSFHKVGLFCDLKTVSAILHKQILSKKQDMAYTLSLLTILRPKDSFKVINEVINRVGCDYSYLLAFANVGIDLCQLLELKEVCVQFQDLGKNAKWGLKFEKLGLSFLSYFTEEEKTLDKGLNDLAQHKDCNIDILDEFSHDFMLNINQVYLCYLKALIRTWYPTSPENGQKENFSLPNDLIIKCQKINFKITDKDLLKEMLKEELNNVCPYNYEVAEILIAQLRILESVHTDMLKTGRDILCFLKGYKRHNLPAPFELEECLNAHPEKRELPAIAKYRLPFHLLYRQPFQNKLLEHELNATNYQQWIGVASFMMLNTDQIYFITARNTLTNISEKKSNLNKRSWEIGSINSSTLSTIQEIIWKIQHPQLAIACGNWVLQNLPYCLDKVVAVQNCIHLCSFWIENSSSVQAKDAFKKFSSMYCKLAIEYSLYKYYLAEPELIALANEPSYLVAKLYEHSKLSSLIGLGNESIPNINNCVTEICTAANEEKETLQLRLLQKWLPLSSNQNDSDEETVSSFKLVLDAKITDDSRNKEKCLSRAVYLLRNFPKEQAISYLLKIAFSTQGSPGTDDRLNSLRCLLAIADEESLIKHSHRSIEDIRLMLQSVTYVSRLEEVGYGITLAYFDSIDKIALVDGLWHALKHVPKAVMLIIDICMNFKVNSTRLWSELLNQITRYVDDKSIQSSSLQMVLMQIKLLPHLWVLPQLNTAWTRLISGMFFNAETPVRGDDLYSCIHAVNLLTHHCPVEIPTGNLVERCILLELPVLAVVIAASDTHHDLVEEILSKFTSKNILLNYEMVEHTLMIPKDVDVYFKELKKGS